MKLVFSEAKPDYGHYIFPYAVWAFPEKGETPADMFRAGFLPSSRELDRFYLCRQVRIRLADFKPSSENRRILRKGEGITARLVNRADFAYDAEKRAFFKSYTDAKFGPQVMSLERFDALFNSRITSHLLVFTDTRTGTEVGTVTLYLEPDRAAYYYYAFYDLKLSSRNLGMYMMTLAVKFFADQGFEFLYLGSCYSTNALYKVQFRGAEFFNGIRWSSNLDELKYLVRRGEQDQAEHLLESSEYREAFATDESKDFAEASAFRVKPVPPAARK